MAEGIGEHWQLQKFFDSEQGKALLNEHELRRSRGPIQRGMESIGIAAIAIHKKSSEGFLDPLGEIAFEPPLTPKANSSLIVYHNKPHGSGERKALVEFAKALSAKFKLRLKYKQRFSYLPDTEE